MAQAATGPERLRHLRAVRSSRRASRNGGCSAAGVVIEWQGGGQAALCSDGSGGNCDRLAFFVQGLDFVVQEAGNAVPIADIGK